MPEKHLRSVKQLVNGNGHLSKLHKRVQDLRDVQQKLNSLLAKPLGDHLQVAHFDSNNLLLHADSAAWATRLRYEKIQIMSQLRQNGWPALTSLEVQVKPSLAKTDPATSSAAAPAEQTRDPGNAIRPLSDKAASHLLQLAEQAPSPLREKLLSLAAHADPASNKVAK